MPHCDDWQRLWRIILVPSLKQPGWRRTQPDEIKEIFFVIGYTQWKTCIAWFFIFIFIFCFIFLHIFILKIPRRYSPVEIADPLRTLISQCSDDNSFEIIWDCMKSLEMWGVHSLGRPENSWILKEYFSSNTSMFYAFFQPAIGTWSSRFTDSRVTRRVRMRGASCGTRMESHTFNPSALKVTLFVLHRLHAFVVES